jgi:hypothetical protein
VKEEGRKLKKCKIKFDERQNKIGVIRQKKKKEFNCCSNNIQKFYFQKNNIQKYHYREITLLMIFNSVSQVSYQFQVRSAETREVNSNCGTGKKCGNWKH